MRGSCTTRASVGPGLDLAIGYAYHEKHSVERYLTESFIFRVLEPTAAVYLKHG